MKNTFLLLSQSRKFWIGTISVAAVFAAVFLRALNMITADALVPMIGAITAAGLAGVGSITWESVSADRIEQAHVEVFARAPAPNVNTTNVTNISKEPSAT